MEVYLSIDTEGRKTKPQNKWEIVSVRERTAKGW